MRPYSSTLNQNLIKNSLNHENENENHDLKHKNITFRSKNISNSTLLTNQIPNSNQNPNPKDIIANLKNRTALGDVTKLSNVVSRKSNNFKDNGLNKPPQRVQVFIEENNEIETQKITNVNKINQIDDRLLDQNNAEAELKNKEAYYSEKYRYYNVNDKFSDEVEIDEEESDEDDDDESSVEVEYHHHIEDDDFVDVDVDDDDEGEEEENEAQIRIEHLEKLRNLRRFEEEIHHIHEEEEFEVADVANQEDDDEDEEETLKPMEPIWNKTIFNELQYVMKKFSRDTLDEEDEDTYDATMVAEYAPEIFNYLHELEIKLSPDPRYMDNQDELKWEMRHILIEWIVQVHGRFNLLPETLFLTINYIDRFLSKRKVSLTRFQLVGAVALFIAAKYEEINCPSVQEIAYMVDNAYTVEDLLKAERFMIDVLEFDMGWPGPMSFLRRTSKADDYDYETRTLAKYLLEITIMDYRFVASQPSWLAAGAHYLSRQLLNKGTWTEAHVFYSGYTETQIRPLAEVLLENCRNAEVNHKSIYDKYLERRYRRSSAFVQEYFQTIQNI